MLRVTGLNHFYYVRDFTDMRCKHSRVLSIIRERLHREPSDGDVFIVMSRNRRIVRMFCDCFTIFVSVNKRFKYDRVQYIIDSKREVLSRETYSRDPINYSEGMADDQKDRFIQYLVDQNQDLRLTSDAMKLVLEDFVAQMKELKEQMASMRSKQSDLENQLSEERKLRKSAERKAKSLQEKLDFANQERFGNRRQRINSKSKKSASDRQKKKDDYDGTDSVDNNESRNDAALLRKERDLPNRPDSYKRMGVVGDPVFHPSDLSRVPGRVIERETVKVFSLRTCLVEERFEMVHYAAPGQKPKWGYFPSDGHPEVVTRLEGMKATPEFFQAIAYEVCVLYTRALNYLRRFWDGMFAFLSDGELPIDNNLAERTIRKLTTQRNNSFHYGGDIGVEMAATYHSVISTVKLHGHSVWDFIGSFFKKNP